MTRRDARPLRFLFLCLGGWAILRAMIVWNPAIPGPVDAASPTGTPPSLFAVPTTEDYGALSLAPTREQRSAAAQAAVQRRDDRALTEMSAPKPPRHRSAAAEGSEQQGHDHLAFMAPTASVSGGSPGGGPVLVRQPSASRAELVRGQPFWIQRSLSGWSLGGWLYLRDGSASAPGPIAAGGQLGGSQAGLRLSYGFGPKGRLRAYGRATMAIEQPQQRDVALGFAFAPIAHLPIDIAIEQRVSVGNQGRTALAAALAGGVSDVALPGEFRLDAYAQAGLVGAHRHDGFVDGQVTIDRRLGPDESAPLRLGALVAGAAQPGAARVDVGPRLTLRLPDVGKGSRIALDWRQRVAGDAHPESGIALTLATDF